LAGERRTAPCILVHAPGIMTRQEEKPEMCSSFGLHHHPGRPANTLEDEWYGIFLRWKIRLSRWYWRLRGAADL